VKIQTGLLSRVFCMHSDLPPPPGKIAVPHSISNMRGLNSPLALSSCSLESCSLVLFLSLSLSISTGVMSGEKSPVSLQKSHTSECVIVRARVRAYICTSVCLTHAHKAHDVAYFGVCRAACTHVCVQMCACVRACMRAHTHMRVCVCMRVRVRVQGNLRKLPRDFGA